MSTKKQQPITIASSTAQYLTFVAATGWDEQSVEMRYEDENIWLTQKMIAQLLVYLCRRYNNILLLLLLIMKLNKQLSRNTW